jgi:putative phage-type endonuclease
MLSERALALRHRSVGASEAAAVAGEDPWHTPMEVWARKVYRLDGVSNRKTARGHYMEPGVVREYVDTRVRENRENLRPRKARRRVHAEHRFITATPDYDLLDDQGAVVRMVECKTVGRHTMDHWDRDVRGAAGVPDYYRVQCQIQMAVTGVRVVDVAAKFMLDDELRVYRVPYDERAAAALVAIIGRFWHEHVVARVPPPLDHSEATRDYLRAKYPRVTVEWKDAPAEAEDWMRRYDAAVDAVSRAERERDLCKHELVALIADAGGIRGTFGHATYKPRKGAPDYKAISEFLLKDVDDAIAARIINEHRHDETRSFRCTYKAAQVAAKTA